MQNMCQMKTEVLKTFKENYSTKRVTTHFLIGISQRKTGYSTVKNKRYYKKHHSNDHRKLRALRLAKYVNRQMIQRTAKYKIFDRLFQRKALSG